MIKSFTLTFVLLIIMTAGFISTTHAKSGLDLLKDIEIHGFASSSYSYNFNKPSNNTNGLRVYDKDDNTFKFDTGELVFKKDANNIGDVGFRTDLSFGFSSPKTNKSTGTNGASTDDDFDLQIGFVQYNAPVGKGLLIDFGKFASHIGAEVLDGYDGWNYIFSRSFIFNYTPNTHTGIRMQYAMSDTLGVLGMISNGQDNQTDTNSAKGVGGQLSWTPLDSIALFFNYFGSAEPQTGNTNNTKDFRNFYNVVSDIGVSKNILLNLNFLYGSEKNANGLYLDAEWWGFSGIVRYDVNEWFSLNFRGQIFDDKDGFLSSTTQKLTAFTFTPEVRVNSNMVIRAEYRRDESDASPFTDENGNTKDSQDTVAFNALFYF